MQERKLSLLYPCGTLLVTVSMACTLISYVKSGFMISRDDNGAHAPCCSMPVQAKTMHCCSLVQ